MKFWGITGGIGSGKSQVLSDLRNQGFPVLDADRVAREVVDPSYPGAIALLQAIARLAGPQVLLANGSLDRVSLRSWMALNAHNRDALEQLLRPKIREEILRWMQDQRTQGQAKFAFIEASRMIESGLHNALDGVLWVTASRELRLVRAAQRDSRATSEIAAIADMQLADDGFASHATQTICNDSDVGSLKGSISNFLRKIGALLLVLSFVGEARAQDSQEWFPSARARSMGLATSALVDDHDSLHTNPAGLALVKERTLRLPDLGFAVSSSFETLIKKFQNLDSGAATSVSQQLQSLDGTAAGFDVSLLSAYWTKPRLGVAVTPIGLVTSARVRTPSVLFAQVDMYAVAQGGVTIGYGHPMLEGRLRAGFALRPFAYRMGIKAKLENQNIIDVSSSLSDNAGGGWGMDADFGLQGNLVPIALGGDASLNLMSGLVLQNALANTYSLTFPGLSGKAPASVRRVNWGFAARVDNPGVLRPTLSVEFRDLFTSYDEFLEFFHVGFELLMRPRNFYTTAFRAGLAKGNVSGGVAFKWQIVDLEMGTYAVNLGPGPGIGRDRRYYIQGALEF